MQWSRVQELYQLPQWISLRLRNVSNGSHLQGRNGRVLGGRRLLYASEKEQSVPTEGSSTTLLQNMYIPRLSCHPRCLCSCRLIDYSILLKRKKKKKTSRKKKKASHLSLSCSLFLSQICAGRWWTVLSELKWKEKNKPTTSLPFITGCLVLNSQNHRDSIVWPKHLMPKFDVKVMIWFPALVLKVLFYFFLLHLLACFPFQTPKYTFQKHHKSRHRSKWNRKLLHPSFFMVESTAGGNGRKLDQRALRTSHRVVFSVVFLGFSQLNIDTFHLKYTSHIMCWFWHYAHLISPLHWFHQRDLLLLAFPWSIWSFYIQLVKWDCSA